MGNYDNICLVFFFFWTYSICILPSHVATIKPVGEGLLHDRGEVSQIKSWEVGGPVFQVC